MKKLLFYIFISVLLVISIKGQNDLPSGLSAYQHAELAGRSGSIEFVSMVQDSQQNFPNDIFKKRFTLKFDDVKLKLVLDRLEILSNAHFVYDSKIGNINSVSIEAEDEELEDILKEILNPHNIGFTLINSNNIVLASFETMNKKTGGIIGKVTDEKGVPLICANISIVENKLGCATDYKGHFEIVNLKPGVYNIKVSYVGYKSQSQDVNVVAGKTVEVNFKLEAESFQIGGIQVIGTSELLPSDVNTKTKINSGEIEHFQATSLGDVLDLVPGIQKTDNPGLNKTSQVAIRGDVDDALSAFGTKIIVDGVPQSNNANLQFHSLTGSKFGGGTIGRGADLREIPADNIETIEVIRGLPSVKYGDFTSGVIEINTKVGSAPNRLKVKNNPNTSEANFGGGFNISDYDAINYNLNIARSERDIRLTGDEYTRFTGQMILTDIGWDGKLNSNYKISGQVIRDEEEPKGDMNQTKNYNRGYKVGFNTWGIFNPHGNVSNLEYSAYVNMERINSRRSKLVQSDLRVLPNGDTVAAYIGALENKGMEWTVGGNMNWNEVFFTGDLIHKVMFGVDAEYDANTGEGIIIDTLYNYYGPDSPRQPRSFDDIPGQLLLSFFAEDKITGNFIFDYSLMFGFRYDMYRPHSLNLSGLWGDGDFVESYQGTFFNPRISLMLYLSEVNQIRMSAGRTSKSPPISRIYPEPYVDNWRNPADSTIYYFINDKTVENLQGYKETQYEISYDHKFFNTLGTTFTAYYRERSAQPVGLEIPVFFETSASGTPQVFYVTSYSKDANIGKYYSKGFEFSIRSAKIKALNMNISVTGSYNFTKNPGSGYYYSDQPDPSLGQFPNYQVPGVSIDTLIGWTYPASGSWRDNIQLNYYIRYTHPELGLWVTLRAEQLVSERRQNFQLVPVDESLLTPSGLESRLFDKLIKTKPVKWLFNLSISKSLFKGAEVSFYVNNFLDDPAINQYYSTPTRITEESRNPNLFYGIEFSMIFDEIFR